MAKKPQTPHELLPHLFRQEYSKMTAVLCRYFGLKNMEIAEDIASDTFLKASEHWALYGIPEHPAAWLYTVAKNKTKDYFKHRSTFDDKVKVEIEKQTQDFHQELSFTEDIISDSQLAMIFNVCNPCLSKEAQICLALQVLCGFSVEEIANAFLSNKETIKKRLQRARTHLRKENFQIKSLDETSLQSREQVVLKTLYLLFNEGYHSQSSDRVIRKDLCLEAIRLTLTLTKHAATNSPKANALLALMCFQSSRFTARIDSLGETILYDNQDRNLWNQELIDRGNYYLVNACSENTISKYHLEAGIAYWHTTLKDENKWPNILQLYNQLLQLEYSPVVALNRTFAFAQVYGKTAATQEAEKLDLDTNPYYHALLGYLYETHNMPLALHHYQKAIDRTHSKAEKKTLQNKMENLKKESSEPH
ncbi:sigma-70 family RNA polymerase sigma factor [Rapidithrix thailandica]|uniref:Sigma-70 family RNA polymerase sigma factor n=1 Tax=Rapidithrix thailandica TaxID=413964 RepID=A0AAW9RVA4_9BACT